MRRVQDELDRLLPAVGLRATRGEGAVAPYDDLIWKLHQEGTYYFSADSLMRECEQAGLATEISPPSPAPHTVGVRSFKRPGVELANQSDDLLCLLDAFDGRFLLPDESWGSVHARMDEFFRRIVAAHRVFRLHLDAHASLAFVAGYLLDAKQGLDISLVQSSRGGVQVWSTATGGKAAGADLSIQEISAGEGDDVALALGITHDVTPDVEQFLTESSPGIGRIIAAQPREGTGQSAVRDSNHAIAIADELARRLKARSIRERAARLHIFAAAPNALMFMLGQLAKGGGHITLYEFDFEGLEGGGYKPSLTVPVE
ncbi:MAG: SAVED domain-containing protein [bacterium]|nr:SAVED domain-containing protein [bacterium]